MLTEQDSTTLELRDRHARLSGNLHLSDHLREGVSGRVVPIDPMTRRPVEVWGQSMSSTTKFRERTILRKHYKLGLQW